MLGKRLVIAGRELARDDRQRGFTLIEMSIVLAIIGLIVGGVLKGQEVLNNARMKSQVAQIDAIKAAVYTFQDRFSYLPGDLTGINVLGTTAITTDGNQDGIVGTHAAGNTAAAALSDAATEGSTEAATAWVQLNAAGLVSGVTYGSGTTIQSATTGLLAGKLSNTWLYFASFTPAAGFSLTGPYVRLQGVRTGAIGGTSTHALRSPDALGLDTKYDDGLPNTGTILVVAPGTLTSCAAGTNADSLYTGTAAATPTCDLLFGVQ